jgi:uncharacterized protein
MKLSKYNYIIKENNVTYWFNGLTLAYFTLENKTSDVLLKYIKTPEILKPQVPSFYNELIEKGFYIENNINEIDLIREAHFKAVNKSEYSLIILPTLDCNFDCWYCVQDHLKTKMDDKTIEKVKKHIYKVVKKDKKASLTIEWFGGEPFMYFDDVIAPITRYAKKLCKKENIPFSTGATTNGYYLKPEIHKKIIDLGFKTFQITLDGVRSLHNSVKHSKNGDSAFDVTLTNINSFLSKTNNTKILLRINYTDKNLDVNIVNEVNEIIEKKNRKKIEILFRRVWQEKVDNKRVAIVNKLQKQFESDGYAISPMDLITDFKSCYAEARNFNTIKHDGTVLKCTANDDLYRKEPLGILQKNGNIEWDKDFLEKYYSVRFENEICLNCKHLPLCMGNCPRDWENESEHEFSCKMSATDGSFNDRILRRIKLQSK